MKAEQSSNNNCIYSCSLLNRQKCKRKKKNGKCKSLTELGCWSEEEKRNPFNKCSFLISISIPTEGDEVHIKRDTICSYHFQPTHFSLFRSPMIQCWSLCSMLVILRFFLFQFFLLVFSRAR